MKIRNLALFLILAATTGCSLDSMFVQPQVTVIGYELVGLPGVNTELLVECDVKNMDTHDGDIISITYTAVIEGVSSLAMTYSTPFKITGGQTLRMKLPLTLPTADAALLLDKLNAGKGLNFTVTGKFTADTFLGRKDLTLNTSGTANVTVGIENFFIQPLIQMNDAKGFRITSFSVPTIFDLNGSVQIAIKEVMVSNKDSRAATVQSVDYTVNIEGANSTKTNYTPGSPIPIAAAGLAGSDILLADMPVKFTYASLITKIPGLVTGSNYVRYTIIGTVKITADLGSGNVDFYLPLNVSGSNVLLLY